MVYGQSVSIQTLRQEIESQAQRVARRIARAAEEAGRERALAVSRAQENTLSPDPE